MGSEVESQGNLAEEYDRWNRALVEWAVSSVAAGASVYLSVDDETLLAVRRAFLHRTGGTPAEAFAEFQAALRYRCVADQQVTLSWVRQKAAPGDSPRCVVFLAAMVLAGSRMDCEKVGEKAIDESNYFARLREVLDLLADSKVGRPPGLDSWRGPEEPLWLEWNRWLLSRGWQPTAERGTSNYDKYINYPLSQALLRRGDRVRLIRFFREQEKKGHLSRCLDPELLAGRLREASDALPSQYLRHLLLDDSDPARFRAILEAVTEVYDGIDWERLPGESDEDTGGPRRLRAGLYRTESRFTGEIQYLLYPRMPRGWQGQTLLVERDGCQHPLQEHRQGWFMPLWSVAPGVQQLFPLRGGEQEGISELMLPARPFWILIHDPDDEAAVVLATWGAPGLGQTFLLLCQPRHEQQLCTLKEEGLLTWQEVEPVTLGESAWLEYRECQVTSPRWSRIFPADEDLVEALRPVASINVVLEGGLRVPGQYLWLEGHQPVVRAYRFDGTAQLRLEDVADPSRVVMDRPVTVNEQVALPLLAPGEYLLQAEVSGRRTIRRLLRIMSWDQLLPGQLGEDFGHQLEDFMLHGASLRANAE